MVEEETAPDLLREIRLVESLLDTMGEGPKATYSSAENPWEAIELCVHNEDDAITTIIIDL